MSIGSTLVNSSRIPNNLEIYPVRLAGILSPAIVEGHQAALGLFKIERRRVNGPAASWAIAIMEFDGQ